MFLQYLLRALFGGRPFPALLETAFYAVSETQANASLPRVSIQEKVGYFMMASPNVYVRDVTADFSGKKLCKIFENLAPEPYSFFLDSGCDPTRLGRYSMFGSNPNVIFRSKGELIMLETAGSIEKIEGNPLDELEKLLKRKKISYDGPLPFVGGALGYFSYDLAWLTEGVGLESLDDVGVWDMEFGFYDTVFVADNLEGKKYVVSSSKEKIEEFRRRLSEADYRDHDQPPQNMQLISNLTRDEYHDAVERIREYIRAGDTYQVNLSQRFSVEYTWDTWEIYKRLREINQAPFSAYLSFGETQILSSSPERFLKIRDGVVETRPIKGTRPRGKTKEEDAALARELASSEKDRAEHIMIVDLERNDLGKVCEYGSVHVPEMQVIESYATVHHMVSTVRGKLRKNTSPIDCIRATFPCGSITGAPKVRAIEIIDELEPTRRGVYCGSIGYLGYNNVADLNIVIRTMIVKDGRLHINVGGGVVYDSTPEEEYQETLDKGEGLFKSLSL